MICAWLCAAGPPEDGDADSAHRLDPRV